MKIETIKVGFLKTNCYLIEKNNKLLIVDPGDEYEKIKNKINGREVVGILITHHHSDHIGALHHFKNIPIYEYPNLEEKTYQIDNFQLEVIYTKGHTNDSVTYYFQNEKIMFTGDFLFHETIGRTDLPTGNKKEMLESIKKIKTYDKDITIYPGHEEYSTLEHEFRYNEYLVTEMI